MKSVALILILVATASTCLEAFSTKKFSVISQQPSRSAHTTRPRQQPPRHTSSSSLSLAADLETVALVAGQENYGFAIVGLIEAGWSFSQAPSFSHAKVLIPAAVSAVVLCAISGPMITSGDASSVALGLEIATVVSLLMGASYVFRMLAPYSPSPKEIAFGGLLIAIAGFFSFSQNLIVDGFINLPSLPALPFELPQLELGQGNDIDTSSMFNIAPNASTE
ncbi:hypothetical protein THAOC_07983 [Thalassiosira oceanica]|uniref:GDT1 family protein n=1 Tax=Thalassiosira oceanica TaxID=159749 RepID=K0SYZ1_THAOC|nr:hypothetical protein THAOC_07983 [Thalassiosira oceanica]|eukprot:EJK70640.1 hypothetical protein THAOC_07983 [Thalassiosira oceanica]